MRLRLYRYTWYKLLLWNFAITTDVVRRQQLNASGTVYERALLPF